MGLALVKNLVVSVEVVVGVGAAALDNGNAVVEDGTMVAEEEAEEAEEGFLGAVLVCWFLVFFLILFFLAGTGTGTRGAAGTGTDESTSCPVLFLNAATTSLLAFLLKNAANMVPCESSFVASQSNQNS